MVLQFRFIFSENGWISSTEKSPCCHASKTQLLLKRNKSLLLHRHLESWPALKRTYQFGLVQGKTSDQQTQQKRERGGSKKRTSMGWDQNYRASTWKTRIGRWRGCKQHWKVPSVCWPTGQGVTNNFPTCIRKTSKYKNNKVTTKSSYCSYLFRVNVAHRCNTDIVNISQYLHHYHRNQLAGRM